MRISDWSSDVCSSDLRSISASMARSAGNVIRFLRAARSIAPSKQADHPAARSCSGLLPLPPAPGVDRSEEHTSELQSLMRISYSVFCLKKKKTTINYPSIPATSSQYEQLQQNL